MSELKYTPKDFKSDQESDGVRVAVITVLLIPCKKRWLNWAIPRNPGL